jgi:hypothetical protein
MVKSIIYKLTLRGSVAGEQQHVMHAVRCSVGLINCLNVDRDALEFLEKRLLQETESQDKWIRAEVWIRNVKNK